MPLHYCHFIYSRLPADYGRLLLFLQIFFHGIFDTGLISFLYTHTPDTIYFRHFFVMPLRFFFFAIFASAIADGYCWLILAY